MRVACADTALTEPVQHSEPISSLLSGADLVGLQDVDGLDKLTGPVLAAAEFPQYPPGFEPGVGALAGPA